MSTQGELTYFALNSVPSQLKKCKFVTTQFLLIVLMFRWDFSLDIWAAAACDAECWSCHNWNCNQIFWPNHAQMKALSTRIIKVRNLWRKEHRAGKTREQQHNEVRVMKENERWARETSIQKTRKWCLRERRLRQTHLLLDLHLEGLGDVFWVSPLINL